MKTPITWDWRWTVLACLTQAAANATTVFEDFASDPLQHGWHVLGDTNHFRWDPQGQRLEVQWDSAQSNSFFFWPLKTIIDQYDDFSFAFDLQLEELTPGTTPGKPYAFEIALGWINLVNARQTNFLRGTGQGTPNLVELDYFPDTGYGATLWPTFISTNGLLNYNNDTDYSLVELPVSRPLRFTATYSAAKRALTTTLTQNGQPWGEVNPVPLNKRFTDFRVNAFSVNCYSDKGAGGSVQARGFIDNVAFQVPDPPMSPIRVRWVQGQWQVQFSGRSNWIYALESSTTLQTWDEILRTHSLTSGLVVLPDHSPAVPRHGYRVRAQKP